ncbi:Thermolysin precursor [Geobacillus sp. BCO2]|nr:Thermolysin precursor [Geobacillus sp. BCO2]
MNKRAMLGAIGLAVGLMAWPLGASAKEKSIVWNEQWKMPSFVSGSLLKGEEAPEQLVYRYLDQEKNTFQLGGQARERLSLIGKQVDELGHTVMRFEQRYHGIPVYGAVLVAHVNDGELSSLSGALIPNLDKQNVENKSRHFRSTSGKDRETRCGGCSDERMAGFRSGKINAACHLSGWGGRTPRL